VCCTGRKSTSSLDLKCANSADLPVGIDRGEKGERKNRSADLPVSIDRGEKGERKNRSADLPVSIDRGEKGERSARRKASKTSGRRRECTASKTNKKLNVKKICQNNVTVIYKINY
jgi:hypothetical protein